MGGMNPAQSTFNRNTFPNMPPPQQQNAPLNAPPQNPTFGIDALLGGQNQFTAQPQSMGQPPGNAFGTNMTHASQQSNPFGTNTSQATFNKSIAKYEQP